MRGTLVTYFCFSMTVAGRHIVLKRSIIDTLQYFGKDKHFGPVQLTFHWTLHRSKLILWLLLSHQSTRYPSFTGLWNRTQVPVTYSKLYSLFSFCSSVLTGLVLSSHLFLWIFPPHGFTAFKDITLSCQLCKLEKPKQPALHDNGQLEQHCRSPR